MQISQISLRNFRNFANLRLDLVSRLNFFVGANAQGKTNLIEAIYFLLRGESFRPTESTSLIAENSNGPADIRARITTPTVVHDASVRLYPQRKEVVLNGKASSSLRLAGIFPAVLFSPEALSVIKAGPEERRSLLDEILVGVHPGQVRLLREFKKALQSRNEQLRLMEGNKHAVSARRTLESLNAIYLVLGAELTSARLSLLEKIMPHLRWATEELGLAGDITVDYLISDQNACNWSTETIFDALQKRAAELHSAELAQGRSLVGPHKHDIRILLSEKDSRFFCSQGQQRSLILALKIAQIVYHQTIHGQYPILLLDDVLSELDLDRQSRLMKFLESISSQVLLTSTEATWSQDFSKKENAIFSVEHGRVAQQMERSMPSLHRELQL